MKMVSNIQVRDMQKDGTPTRDRVPPIGKHISALANDLRSVGSIGTASDMGRNTPENKKK